MLKQHGLTIGLFIGCVVFLFLWLNQTSGQDPRLQDRIDAAEAANDSLKAENLQKDMYIVQQQARIAELDYELAQEAEVEIRYINRRNEITDRIDSGSTAELINLFAGFNTDSTAVR